MPNLKPSLLLESTVTFCETQLEGYQTGALDICMPHRRVISLPTQLGCRVGCTFCVSRSSPLIRNLTSMEMLALVQQCLKEEPSDGRPIELSFTGEGEALLNWRAAGETCCALPGLSKDFNAVRYCFSGIGADKLLGRLEGGPYPIRLQFSLHGARQVVRDRLVPCSLPLASILPSLHSHEHRFSRIELNVVLQDGVNDSEDDLQALINWGAPHWPVVLNPLLQDGIENVATRTRYFESALIDAGRTVLRYEKIAARLSRDRIYPLLTARKIVTSSN